MPNDPARTRGITIWHGGWLFYFRNPLRPSVMLSNLKQYVNVKREAMRLMMSGDLARYMRKLRELQEMRSKLGGLVA